MSATNNAIFTIGHSNHSLDAFLALLGRHCITAVADVRSAPYSRFNPHFNRDSLAAALKGHGVGYMYLGRELGGRSGDPACYEEGRIRYDRVARTSRFRDGLERVIREAAKHRITLMCAEKEPLDCHRTLLIARALAEEGVEIAHIHPDRELESHSNAMDRLLAKFDLQPDGDLFRREQPRAELIDEAIARQTQRIAFVDDKFAAQPERRT